MIERASLRNKCKVLCFWASKLLKEREFGGKMQNIGLEMRKCVAGGQKMGLQTPNSTTRPRKQAPIRRGAGGFPQKRQTTRRKRGRLVLNSTFRAEKQAPIRRGAGGFPQKKAARSEKAGGERCEKGQKKRRTPRRNATRGLVLRRSRAFCVRTWRFLI